MQTAVYILLIIWLILSIYSVCLQISIALKNIKHAKDLEKSIKNFDNVMGETFKDMARDKFFEEIEELKEENKEEGENEDGRE